MRPFICFVAALQLMSFVSSASGAVRQKEVTVTRLAEGVHGLVWTDALADPIEGNILVIINAEDVVLVDSSFMPSTARRVVSEVRKLTDKPVRFVVNTHWHNDHVQGNQAFREAWPNVQFIAHAHTRTDALEFAWGQVAKGRAQAEEARARYVRWLAEGKDDDGKQLDEARRKRVEEVISFFDLQMEETKDLRPTPPDITLNDSLTLHRGDRTIEIRHLGLGNTRGDVVVFLPRERIVATGDLVVHPEPFGFGSYYKEWVTTLERLEALPADTFFPGHGAVQRDRTYLATLRALFIDMTRQVDAAVAEGLSLEETKKKVTLADWKTKLAGTNERTARSFEAFFVQPAVERAWKQAKGEPGAREQGQ